MSQETEKYIAGNGTTIMLERFNIQGGSWERHHALDLSDVTQLQKYFLVRNGNNKFLRDTTLEPGNPRGFSKTDDQYSYWAKFYGILQRSYKTVNYTAKFKQQNCKVELENNVIVNASINNICPFCLKPLTHLHVDHCWNLQFNNLLGVIDRQEGYVSAHGKCNISKSDKLYFPESSNWQILVNKTSFSDEYKEDLRKFTGYDGETEGQAVQEKVKL